MSPKFSNITIHCENKSLASIERRTLKALTRSNHHSEAEQLAKELEKAQNKKSGAYGATLQVLASYVNLQGLTPRQEELTKSITMEGASIDNPTA